MQNQRNQRQGQGSGNQQRGPRQGGYRQPVCTGVIVATAFSIKRGDKGGFHLLVNKVLTNDAKQQFGELPQAVEVIVDRHCADSFSPKGLKFEPGTGKIGWVADNSEDAPMLEEDKDYLFKVRFYEGGIQNGDFELLGYMTQARNKTDFAAIKEQEADLKRNYMVKVANGAPLLGTLHQIAQKAIDRGVTLEVLRAGTWFRSGDNGGMPPIEGMPSSFRLPHVKKEEVKTESPADGVVVPFVRPSGDSGQTPRSKQERFQRPKRPSQGQEPNRRIDHLAEQDGLVSALPASFALAEGGGEGGENSGGNAWEETVGAVALLPGTVGADDELEAPGVTEEPPVEELRTGTEG